MDSVQVDSLAPPAVHHRLAVGAIVAVHQPFAVAGAAGWVSHSTTQARGRDEMRRERGPEQTVLGRKLPTPLMRGVPGLGSWTAPSTFRGSLSSRGVRRVPRSHRQLRHFSQLSQSVQLLQP